MFLNKKNGKLYPDYRDKCFVDKNGNKCYWVPNWFQDQGFPKYIVFEDWDRFYTKKQLEKKKLQPVEGYYGMKWYTNSKKQEERKKASTAFTACKRYKANKREYGRSCFWWW